MRSKRLLGSDSSVLQACVLGLPLQGWKFDSESSVSRGYWDCLIPLPHRVRNETFMILNLVGCKYILFHVCVDRCLSRLDNPTRIWKLKLENKDLLFVAFQQKKPQSLHKLCMSRETCLWPCFQEWLWKTQTLAWLGLVCYLLVGPWNGNRLQLVIIQLNDVMFGLIMISTLRRLYIVVFYFLLQNFSLILSFCETSLVSFGIKLVKARASAN